MKLHTTNTRLCLVLSLTALTLSGCLRTRGMIRESEGLESDARPPQVSSASANESYVIDELKAEITRLSGRIEELERAKAEAATQVNPQLKAYEDRISELEKAQLAMLETLKGQKSSASSGAGAPAAAPDAPGTTGLEQGKALFQAGKFDAAVEPLSQFITQSGKAKSPKLEEAIILLGESYFLLKQYQSAIVEYSKIQEKFPKSKRIPTALLRIAQSFEALGFEEDSRGFYQELLDRFPQSPEAKKAQEHKSGKKKSRPKAKA